MRDPWRALPLDRLDEGNEVVAGMAEAAASDSLQSAEDGPTLVRRRIRQLSRGDLELVAEVAVVREVFARSVRRYPSEIRLVARGPLPDQPWESWVRQFEGVLALFGDQLDADAPGDDL